MPKKLIVMFKRIASEKKLLQECKKNKKKKKRPSKIED
jgi:hypothetical protein